MAATGRRDRMARATLASVTIHSLAALLIPALAWTTSSVSPVVTVSFSHVLHIQISTPPPHPRPRPIAPRHSQTPTVTFASRIRTVAVPPHRRSAPAPAVATNAPAAPAVGVVPQAGEGKAEGNAAPDATPSPVARAVASVGTHQTGGNLPFGAEQPDPVLDPGTRRQLEALGVHVTLTITVGDDGRTQNVDFAPPLDSPAEDRIRALLAQANWDPAVCGGGVTCVGRAVITL